MIEWVVFGLLTYTLIPEGRKTTAQNIKRMDKVPYLPFFAIRLFEGRSDADLSKEVMGILMDALIRIDIMEFQNYDLPWLYDSGIRYEKIVGRKDTPWKDAIAANETKLGNCKVLVALRIAELRIKGEKSATYELIQVINNDGTQDWHVVVKRFDKFGKSYFEDPSKKLGME